MTRLLILILSLWLPVNAFAQNYSVGSNIAGMAMGSLNIETSLALSRRVSLHLPFMWSPFSYKENIKLTHLAVMPGLRVWSWHVYSGFYTGLHTSYIRYNGGLKEKRYDGNAIGLSLSAGYSKMLSRRWNLEIEAGAGVFRTNHDVFRREICGEYLDSSRKIRVLPSRVLVNVIFIL
ncbi:MAG: DUF3575 domain-containing protein [Bacteroidales bacterium]|nr:DUF3575 domain-containing protein [Bacteroidales bacterium]